MADDQWDLWLEREGTHLDRLAEPVWLPEPVDAGLQCAGQMVAAVGVSVSSSIIRRHRHALRKFHRQCAWREVRITRASGRQRTRHVRRWHAAFQLHRNLLAAD